MKYELKSLNLKSTAKIYAVLLGVIYLVIGGVFFLVNIIVSLVNGEFTIVGFASALLSLFLIIILTVLLGAFSGVVIAWLYNKIADKVGGIGIELGKVEDNKEED